MSGSAMLLWLPCPKASVKVLTHHDCGSFGITGRNHFEQPQMLPDMPAYLLVIGQHPVGEQPPDRIHALQRFDVEGIGRASRDLFVELAPALEYFAHRLSIQATIEDAGLLCREPRGDGGIEVEVRFKQRRRLDNATKGIRLLIGCRAGQRFGV